jgi:hypothetical protein
VYSVCSASSGAHLRGVGGVAARRQQLVAGIEHAVGFDLECHAGQGNLEARCQALIVAKTPRVREKEMAGATGNAGGLGLLD